MTSGGCVFYCCRDVRSQNFENIVQSDNNILEHVFWCILILKDAQDFCDLVANLEADSSCEQTHLAHTIGFISMPVPTAKEMCVSV